MEMVRSRVGTRIAAAATVIICQECCGPSRVNLKYERAFSYWIYLSIIAVQSSLVMSCFLGSCGGLRVGSFSPILSLGPVQARPGRLRPDCRRPTRTTATRGRKTNSALGCLTPAKAPSPACRLPPSSRGGLAVWHSLVGRHPDGAQDARPNHGYETQG